MPTYSILSYFKVLIAEYSEFSYNDINWTQLLKGNMMNKKTKNRWLIAVAAVGIHISIGSVYSWSVFTKHIQNDLGFSLSEVSRIFSIAILFLGLSAAFMGHFVEKFGPRLSGLVSTIFFISGLLLSSYAISVESLPLLYLGYGVLSGIGLGIGYIAPVSTLVKWFPDKRGMATD